MWYLRVCADQIAATTVAMLDQALLIIDDLENPF